MNDKVEKTVQTFDWVTERSSCSLPKVFKELSSQVQEDIKVRNGLRPANSPYEFSMTENVGEFTVLFRSEGMGRSVIFTLAEHGILVRDDQGNPMFEVTLTFTDEGKCRLNVNEQERELWQVRRMALEGLFFHG